MEQIYKFVDDALSSLKELNMMKLPIKDMPSEMIDESQKAEPDSIYWKPIDSTVTDGEIQEIEMLAKIEFPKSFKVFLKYKHFYELACPQPMDVVFFRHPIRGWQENYTEYYSYDWVKGRLLDNAYLPFAAHQDWGIICFDANRNTDTKEYPVIMIDHDIIYDAQITFEAFGDNFLDLIEKRLKFD